MCIRRRMINLDKCMPEWIWRSKDKDKDKDLKLSYNLKN